MMTPNRDAPGKTPSPRAAAYTVRVADLRADRDTVLGMWRGHTRVGPEAKYKWFYLQHPCGEQTLLMLTHGPQANPVGVAGLGTRDVCIRGVSRTAGVLADLVVLPEHRILFPALLLQKQMRQTALATHGIVYGLPNRHSTPIVKRLGYTRIGEFVRYSKVLRHGVYLERLSVSWLGSALGALVDRIAFLYFKPYAMPGAWLGSWVDSVDERFDALWLRVRQFDGLIGTRDVRFLSWRFSSQPGQQYRVFAIAAKGKPEIVAYAICEAEGRTLHVRDFLADPSRDQHLRMLVHMLAHEAYHKGYSNLSLEFLGPRHLHGILTAAGMVERGRRALYAGADPQQEALLSRMDWYMTCADEDQ